MRYPHLHWGAAAAAALLLGTAGVAATSHYELHGNVNYVMAYSPAGEAIGETNSVFTVGDTCTVSFDYTPDGAVDLSPPLDTGVYNNVFTNVRISFNRDAYVATADRAPASVYDNNSLLAVDSLSIAGPLLNPQFPAVDGYQYSFDGVSLLDLSDPTQQAFGNDSLPATISNLFLNGAMASQLNLHFRDTAGGLLWVDVRFGSQEIRPPFSYLNISSLFRDNDALGYYVAAGAQIYDPSYADPITALTITYPDGTKVGSRSGGYRSGWIGGNNASVFAGDPIENRRDIPNGPYTVSVQGGLRDGLTLTYNADRNLIPPLAPRILSTSQYALEHTSSNRPITVYLWPFIDRRRNLTAGCSLEIVKIEQTNTGMTRKPIFKAANIAPDAISTTIPANTLGAGSYEVIIIHHQNGPVSQDGVATFYSSANTITITRQR